MQNNIFESLDINHFIIVPFPTAQIPYNTKRFGMEQFPNVKMSLLNLHIHVQWHSKKKIYILSISVNDVVHGRGTRVAKKS
jgi:hypothetical protein